MEACKEARWKARGRKIKCKSQVKWFDRECETEKENLQFLGEKISRNINDAELRQLLRDKKKRFKQTCRRKKRESISKGMSNIDICRTPKRPGDKQKKSLTQEKEKHMELKQ